MRRTRLAVDCSDADASLETVETLARAGLNARRAGCRIQVRNARPDLVELLDLAGLAGLLLELQGQAEQGKQAGGVEEERELDDPPVL